MVGLPKNMADPVFQLGDLPAQLFDENDIAPFQGRGYTPGCVGSAKGRGRGDPKSETLNPVARHDDTARERQVWLHILASTYWLIEQPGTHAWDAR